MAVGYLGLILQGGCLLAIGTFISTTTRNQIVAGVATFGVCLLLWVLDWVSQFDSSPVVRSDQLSFRDVSLRILRARGARFQRRDLLPEHDRVRPVPDGTVDGIDPVEGVMATTKTHRAANFAQAAVYTLIIVAILGVLNFLAQRYNKSFDSTANKKYTLSDQTAKVVKNIPGRSHHHVLGPAQRLPQRAGSLRPLQGTFAESRRWSIRTSTRIAPRRSRPA